MVNIYVKTGQNLVADSAAVEPDASAPLTKVSIGYDLEPVHFNLKT